MTTEEMQSRFALKFDKETSRRNIAGMDVIVHCHHYNARIQRSIQSPDGIDGKKIFSSAAEAVFARQIRNAFRPTDSLADKWDVVAGLYGHLGYGKFDRTTLDKSVISATHSHFVEGWNAGFPERKLPVCSMTEGYLQAALREVTGKNVYVREEQCIATGASTCQFKVDTNRTEAAATYDQKQTATASGELAPAAKSNIDEEKIIGALVGMPIHGNADGLTPAFNVYLANVPIDFYNLVSIRFVDEMDRLKMGDAARKQLTHDAEFCGLNTFRGILGSPEWEGLIKPMVKEERDTLHGIVAVSNALGWGNWRVLEHTPKRSLKLASRNGYEATGFLQMKGAAKTPSCLMLTGVAAGIMELVYGEGSMRERFGQYTSQETACRTTGGVCSFEVKETE